MSVHVLCIGDVMLDVITEIEVVPNKVNYGSDTPAKISTHGGGAAGNVASWLTRTDAQATIVAHVGNDSAGSALVSEFNALGVGHKNLVVEGAHSGVVVVLVDPSGERTMFPDNGANSGLKLSDLPNLDDVNAVYLSGYSPLDPLSRTGVLEMIAKIRSAGIPIYFDPASVGGMMQADLVEVKSWIAMMDVILLNEEEAMYLTGESNVEIALQLLNQDCPVVVIKRGAAGAIGCTRGSSTVSVPALPAHVVDTTGAGDSFAAGFIAQYALTKNMEQSLEAGTKVAARCVAIVGARPRVGTSI